MTQIDRTPGLIREAERLAPSNPKVKIALANFNRVAPRGLRSSMKFSSNPQANEARQALCNAVLDASNGVSANGIQLVKGKLSFSAGVSVDTSSGLSEKPIRIVARTSGAAFHEIWGKCIHDMAGYIPSDGPVPLDYNHNPDEAIGVADKMAIVDGELIADGRLTPFKPDDSASKVIHQGKKGVPLQASVTLDPSTVQIQKLEDGETAQVNGNEFAGPGTIFRKWKVDGIAITPYGSDSNTSVEFSRSAKSIRNRATLAERIGAALCSKS